MKIHPRPPVEGIRPDRFSPPHCPWPSCPAFRRRGHYRPQRFGSYRRQCDPRKKVPRYRCRECGRTFSRQTFATSYRLRRPELLREVASLLVSCSAHRQIARHLGCSKSTVASMARRLGEHAIDFHRSVVRPATEPVVFDHFETFVRSQVERLSLGTAVGRDSWFVYGISAAETIRKGRRSARKRVIRRKLVEAPAGELVRSTLEGLARRSRRTGVSS